MTEPPKSERLPQGSMIAGKYRVERVLGEGGMGIVYEAEHVALRERVAIKLLHSRRSSDQEIARRFVSEARTAVKIKSDAVARVLDVGTTDDGLPFIVMEKLDGEDLGALIDRAGALTVPQAVDFLLQACEAVAAAHAVGIIHRDLKPSNLFIAEDGAGELRVKVLDFGISKVFEEEPDSQRPVTTTSAVLGSPGYMAPEQMRASRDVDARTDVWALGMILWESIAGTPMFAGKTYPEICAKVLGGHFLPLSAIGVNASDELEQTLERTLALDPNDRFASVAEFAAAIATFGPEGSEGRVSRISNLARAPSDRQRQSASIRPPVALSPTVPALPSTTDPIRKAARAKTDGPLATDAARGGNETEQPRSRAILFVLVAAVFVTVGIGVIALQSADGPPPAVPAQKSPLPSPLPSPSPSPLPSPSPSPSPLPSPSLSPLPSVRASAKAVISAAPSSSVSPASSMKPANGAPILH